MSLEDQSTTKCMAESCFWANLLPSQLSPRRYSLQPIFRILIDSTSLSFMSAFKRIPKSALLFGISCMNENGSPIYKTTLSNLPNPHAFMLRGKPKIQILDQNILKASFSSSKPHSVSFPASLSKLPREFSLIPPNLT